MLLVIIAVAMVTVLALAFLNAQGTTTGIAANVDRQGHAQYIAESALTMAVAEMKANTNWRTTFTNGVWVNNQAMNAGTFTLRGEDGIDSDGNGTVDGDGDLTDDPAELVTLTAIATFQGVSHTARMIVHPGGEEGGNGLQAEYHELSSLYLLILRLTAMLSLDQMSTQLLNVLNITGWQNIPSYTEVVPNINITLKNSSARAWSGGPTDYFAIRYRGQITIPATGTWTFWTDSDDGSDLWIDGVRVVNNDGLHSMALRSGSKYLTAGTHEFTAGMYEWTGDFGMIVSWQGPGVSTRTVIPATAFSHGGGGSSSVVPTPGILTKDDIRLSSDALIDSYKSSSGAYGGSNSGSRAVVATNTTGAGDVRLQNSSQIRGDVYVGAGGNPSSVVQTDSAGQITGAKAALPAALPVDTVSAPTGMPGSLGDVTLNGNTVTVSNANYTLRNFKLAGDSTLYVSGNVVIYCTDTFEMDGTSQIILNSGAALTLYAYNQALIKGNSRINPGGNPAKVSIRIIASDRIVKLDDDAQVYASIRCPRGDLLIYAESQLFGISESDDLEIVAQAQFHVDTDNSGEATGNTGTVGFSVTWVEPGA